MGDIDANVSGAFTFNAWVKLDVLQLGRIIHGSDANHGISIFYNASNLNYRMGTGATYTNHAVSFTDTTSWHMVTITWNGSTVEYFLDGISKGTDSSATYGDTASYAFGRRHSNADQFWNGKIDDMAWWNSQLSNNDISDLYNSGNGLYIDGSSNFPTDGGSMGTNLEGNWHIDEGTGTTSTADSSGNGHTITLQHIEEGDWVAGHINVPGSEQEAVIWSAEDGTSAGAYGKVTIGNNTADMIINAGEINLKIGGNTKWTIDNSGALKPPTIADADAPNNSIYYSSTASKLVYKDSGGSVNNLY